MKFVKVESLTGKEYLAKAINSKSGVVLIDENTQLRQEYIDKLVELGIFSVFIKDDEEIEPAMEPVKEAEPKPEPLKPEKKEKVTKTPPKPELKLVDHDKKYTLVETKEDSLVVVRDVLTKHVYKHNQELKELGNVAGKVIEAVVEEPEIIEAVTEIRNISTDLYSHAINVSMLATIMALRLGMSEEDIRIVSIGSILHDIGLRYTDINCDGKYVEELTLKDQLEFKKHTINGYTSVQEETWMPEKVKEIILLHHECIDGTGYPFRLSGKKLSPQVRLVSICDCFDSMISGIGSRKHKIYEAIEYLRCNSETKFDKQICSVFMSTVALYPVGTKVILNTGEKAVVVEQNKKFMDRPIVRATEHANGKPCVTNIVKDLIKSLDIFIVDTL